MMKKNFLLILLALLGVVTLTNAQESTDAQESTYNDYNHWSLDLAAGFHKPSHPFAPDYFTNTPSFYQVELAGRYMITEKAGLKLGLGMNSFEADEASFPFKSRLYRVTLEGVANAGNILGFRDWTNRLNLLIHAGGGYAKLVPSEPNDVDFGDGDQMLQLTGGVTPQLRLSNHVTLFADVSIFGNIRQDFTYDGTAKTSTTGGDSRGVNGDFVNASVGLSIALGSKDVHADWYSRENTMAQDIDSLQNRLDKLENDLMDSDQDGVPDYLDREPDTTSGVAVDSHGVAIDKNKNGIPDELESSLDARYAAKGSTTTGTGGDIIEKLINDGYVNVYFKFNSTQPETYSLESINYLIKYMKENPGANADLIGYADEIGDASYNQTLSEKRAQKVNDILVAAGIDENRLSVTGNGEDNTVDKSSGDARQLVRRVTFKLK